MSETILIADDHPLFRQALVMAATDLKPQARIHEAGNFAQALEVVRANAADPDASLSLILLDLKMPGVEGYSGIARLHAEAPTTPILVVSASDPKQVTSEVLRAGAVGFVGKDQPLEAIRAAIDDALKGVVSEAISPRPDHPAGLTPTQLRVLTGVLAGRLNKQIAFDLNISEATVKAHMTEIMRKLDVRNRTQAVLAARSLGLGAES